jgi:hypothetical protein
MADFRKKDENMNALAAPAIPILNEHTRVLNALNNPNFTWRTIHGISRKTEIPIVRVKQILRDLSDSVIRSFIPDDEGRALYTTLKQYRAHSGILRRVLSALSDQVK